jgi:cytochrome c553
VSFFIGAYPTIRNRLYTTIVPTSFKPKDATMLKPIFLIIISINAFAPTLASAAGDAVAGKAKSAMCQGCHGVDGNSMVPNFPKLAGQFSGYITKQIQNFHDGSRHDDTMTSMAMTLTARQDILDVSAYFASQPKMTGTPSEDSELVAQGEALYIKHDCIGCHGESGKGKTNSFPFIPVIGGQHAEYIIEQFIKFDIGERANDMSGTMNTFAADLFDEEIEALAEYLSSRQTSNEISQPTPDPKTEN